MEGERRERRKYQRRKMELKGEERVMEIENGDAGNGKIMESNRVVKGKVDEGNRS